MILAKMKKKTNERGSQAKEKTANQNQASLLRGYFNRFSNYKHLMVRVGLNKKKQIQILLGQGFGISKIPSQNLQKIGIFSDLPIFLSHGIFIPEIENFYLRVSKRDVYVGTAIFRVGTKGRIFVPTHEFGIYAYILINAQKCMS